MVGARLSTCHRACHRGHRGMLFLVQSYFRQAFLDKFVAAVCRIFVFGCCFICILSPCSCDAMHRADYAAVATCLSVCPSVTRQYSVEVARV